MSHDSDTCNPGPTPGNSPDEMSTDSDEGIAQHIENIPLTSPTGSASTDATVTPTGGNKTSRPPLAPLPGPARSPRWPPYPFRPSDQECLLRNTTNTFVITITDDPDADYHIEPVNEASLQPTVRPPHRSRDSGYDADESSNVTDNELESESEGSDEGRLGAARIKHQHEGVVGGQESGHGAEKTHHSHHHHQQNASDTVTATATATPTGDDDDYTMME